MTAQRQPSPEERAPALEQIKAELNALSSDELVYINFDIPAAVSLVLRKLPAILGFRSEIAATLPRFDVAQLERLELYALALRAAHAGYLEAARVDGGAPAVVREARALRHTLRADANALARRGHLETSEVSSLKSRRGYQGLAADLDRLVAVLERRWPVIEGRCAVLAGELERATRLAEALRCAAKRGKGVAARLPVADLRARAFTLFVKAYDEARAAILYIRRNAGDADELAPSLFAGRSNGRNPEKQRAKRPSEIRSLAELGEAGRTRVPRAKRRS